MSKYMVLVLATVFIPLQTSADFDWYSLTEANFAAVQTGLAQLTNASNEVNRTIQQVQGTVTDAINGLKNHIAQGLADLQARYPARSIDTSQLNSFGYFTGYIPSVLDQWRQSLITGVMVPAQAVVRNILSAMTEFYFSPKSYCAQKNAPDLVQPRISVGRLKNCLERQPKVAEEVGEAMQLLMDDGKAMADDVLTQRHYCSASDATNCTNAYFNNLPNQISTVIWNVANLQNFPHFWTDTSLPYSKGCVAIISADIQDAIQAIRDNIAQCS